MEEKTKLHFTRIRAKGDSSFYDPGADIRQLLPSIAKTTLMALQDKYADTKLMQEFLVLHNFFCIFQLRLAEDQTPCAEQILEFCSAEQQVSAEARAIWNQYLVMLLLCTYGLFTRRDVRTDGAVVSAMLDTGRFASLMEGLSEETRQRIRQEIGTAANEALTSPGHEEADPRGYVVCEETKEVLENIKTLAGIYISHTGANDWNSLAAACDKEFWRGGKPDKAAIALALSYPTYKQPSLTVEVGNADQSKADETATP